MLQSGTEQLRASARRLRVVELRITGLGFREIAETLGVSAMTAHRDLQKAIGDQRAKLKETTEVIIQLELERLDYMLSKLWPKVESGDVLAIDQALKVSDRRRKLLGLDAPAKIAPTDPSGEKEAGGVVIYIPDNGRGPIPPDQLVPDPKLTEPDNERS